jgi:hypothetical protein
VNRVALLSADDRALAFEQTAIRMGLGAAIVVEKDFWVCWTLLQIFSIAGFPAPLFKGGTSLSKAYGLIQRFSEDVDLVLDRHSLGFAGPDDPAGQTGSKQKKRSLDLLRTRCAETVRDQVRPAIEARFRRELGDAGWMLDPDPADAQCLLFAYPRALRVANGGPRYLRPIVRLEFGCRGDVWPSEARRIHPYLADYFPQLFNTTDCEVRVLKPERTFSEKVTLLHAVFHSGKRPDRLSRHYYDVSRLYRALGDAALADVDLLAHVVEHKTVFFREPAAKYETARPGTLCITPGKELETALRSDWREMEEMLFHAAPGFDEILTDIRAIEERVNHGLSP